MWVCVPTITAYACRHTILLNAKTVLQLFIWYIVAIFPAATLDVPARVYADADAKYVY